MAARDGVSRKEHPREIGPHQPLDDDRHVVAGVEAFGLAVGSHSVRMPRAPDGVDRLLHHLVGVYVQDGLKLASKRGLGRVLAQGR